MKNPDSNVCLDFGTVRKYLKFFSFAQRRNGGGGMTTGKRKLEEKPEENRGGEGVENSKT